MCLTLFAEMVKSKPWTPATLQEFGGTTGIGVTFLEETFGDRTAAVGDRLQQQAARAVLQALLPDPGSDIKGGMRSEDELLHATGCTDQPREFAELLNLLDAQLRLITATDPEGQGGDEEHLPSRGASDRYYQSAHVSLVPSLRQWLTQKRTETRRGRAEICLGDRSGMWRSEIRKGPPSDLMGIPADPDAHPATELDESAAADDVCRVAILCNLHPRIRGAGGRWPGPPTKRRRAFVRQRW